MNDAAQPAAFGHREAAGDDLILSVERASKKFCRNLKRAMWYGLSDIAGQFRGRKPAGFDPPKLRPGEFFAVRDASFSIRRGECVGLIGPNGAGKSTMLKMVNGLIRPDAGRIAIRGRTGALIELGTGFNPVLSGRENVFVNAAVLGLSRDETRRRFDQIVDFAGLGHVIDDPVKTYSSGMKLRLGYAVAAHLDPDLLIMDEVLAVGDVGFRMKCFQHLNELPRRGTAIIIVTHAVGMLPRVCSRTIVFDQGQIVFDGDVQKGIAIYEERLTVPERVVVASQAQSAGDRPARIASVTACSLSGRPLEGLETNDGLLLKIVVECAADVPRAKLIVALSSPRAETISSISSQFQSIRPDLSAGRHEIEFVLPSVPLLVGGYYFDVSLYGSGLYDFIDRRMGVGSFQVTGPPVDAAGDGLTGMLRLDHHWRIPGHKP